MPRKKTAAKTATKKTAAKPTARKAAAPATQAAAPASPGVAEAQEVAPESGSPGGVCPRCGTSKFAPEPRIRTEGSRTVRFTILVCERGHTFARPIASVP